jgi:CBS domain containing-hemolysin-like protein
MITPAIGVAMVSSVLLLVIAGMLRAAGASLVRTPRADALHDGVEGDKRAQVVADMLSEVSAIQPSVGLVNSALALGAVIPGSWALSQVLEGWLLVASLVALWVAALVFGDMVPRGYGRNRPGSLAYSFSGLLHVAVAAGKTADDWVADEPEPETLELDQDADELHREELELISSVLDFSDALVREVMTPRPDMVTIAATDTSDQVLDVIVETGYSRIPVTGDNIDDIVGVAHARDLLKLLDDERSAVPVSELARQVVIVPETKRVSDMLKHMQASQSHMAVVVDEFGGTAGLVTIEDLLEEIVGEITDEFDDEEALIQDLGNDVFLVDGRCPVEDLSEQLDVALPEEEWDTVGGLVLALAGRVPKKGEVFSVEGVQFVVARLQGRRIANVQVQRMRG